MTQPEVIAQSRQRDADDAGKNVQVIEGLCSLEWPHYLEGDQNQQRADTPDGKKPSELYTGECSGPH